MNLFAFTRQFLLINLTFAHVQKLKKKEKESFEKDNNLGENLFFFERHLGENFVWCFPLQSRLNSHARGDNLQVSNPLIGSRFLGRIIFQFQRQPRLRNSRGPDAPPIHILCNFILLHVHQVDIYHLFHIFSFLETFTLDHS